MKRRTSIFYALWFVCFSSQGQIIPGGFEVVHDPLQTAAVLASLGEQLRQLKEEVRSLSSFHWNNLDNEAQLKNLAAYLQNSGNLASSAHAVETEFKTYFSGYQSPKGTHYDTFYTHLVEDSRSALKSVMQLMASINSETDPMHQHENLSKIQMQISSAENPVQATQGLAQITGQLASNLEVLQKTMAAQASAQDAYYATQLQTQASNEAGMKQMFDNGQRNAKPMGNADEAIHFENH